MDSMPVQRRSHPRLLTCYGSRLHSEVNLDAIGYKGRPNTADRGRIMNNVVIKGVEQGIDIGDAQLCEPIKLKQSSVAPTGCPCNYTGSRYSATKLMRRQSVVSSHHDFLANLLMSNLASNIDTIHDLNT